MAGSTNDTVDYLKAMRGECFEGLNRLDKIIGDIESAFATKPGFANNRAWQQFHESLRRRVETISIELEQIERLLKYELAKLQQDT